MEKIGVTSDNFAASQKQLINRHNTHNNVEQCRIKPAVFTIQKCTNYPRKMTFIADCSKLNRFYNDDLKDQQKEVDKWCF